MACSALARSSLSETHGVSYAKGKMFASPRLSPLHTTTPIVRESGFPGAYLASSYLARFFGRANSPPRHRVQQPLKHLLIELRVSRREMAARFIARQYQIQPAVLHTLHRAGHDPCLRRIALIVSSIDCKNRRLNFLKVG